MAKKRKAGARKRAAKRTVKRVARRKVKRAVRRKTRRVVRRARRKTGRKVKKAVARRRVAKKAAGTRPMKRRRGLKALMPDFMAK